MLFKIVADEMKSYPVKGQEVSLTAIRAWAKYLKHSGFATIKPGQEGHERFDEQGHASHIDPFFQATYTLQNKDLVEEIEPLGVKRIESTVVQSIDQQREFNKILELMNQAPIETNDDNSVRFDEQGHSHDVAMFLEESLSEDSITESLIKKQED